MSAAAIQRGIYTALTSSTAVMALVRGVYDNPTQVADPENPAYFPIITIGDDTITPWDTDTETGFECDATIHVWSMAGHRLECKQIQDAIYSAIHRDVFTVDGALVVGCDLTTQDAQRDPDGLTIHGVQIFKIILERV